MTRFFRSLKNEARNVVPVFLFFLVFFSIINETESFLFRMAGLPPISFLDVAIAAALFAKIFLVLDHLPVSRLFIKKPLIYHVVFKTVFYWIVSFIVRMGTRFFHYLVLGQGLAVEWHLFSTQINWRLQISIQSWCVMLLFLFVGVRELSRVIGREKMRNIFFGK